MTWAKRIGVGFLVLIGLIAAFIAWKILTFTPAPDTFKPNCKQTDAACLSWTDFRRGHPYPYQTVAARRLDDNNLVLVISEPGPVLSKQQLLDLVKAIFGNDLLTVERMNWHIGIDGWVEDLVLTLRAQGKVEADPLAEPRLRDQVALLHLALFGTTFGGDLEDISSGALTSKGVTAPKFHVTANEIGRWVGDASLEWQRIDEVDAAPMAWGAIDSATAVGAFTSSDRTLAMLTFPIVLLHNAKKDRASLDALRIPFRQFAVSADAVFGGFWTTAGQVTLLGRVRRTPLSLIPPLRFETFELLAMQKGDELAQSFERTAVFAGKLLSGENFGKDWAPIFLSPVLVDTELGALLNITDQMLKSWSLAGGVEYVYFDYPKPAHFPFNGRSIMDIIREEQGGRSVLFNWNTSGSAVVIKTPKQSIFVVNETSALPVTYGANGKVKAAGGADMLKYEEEAFAYFAGLGDPNLARVAQYTAIYQMFRAIARDAEIPHGVNFRH